VRVSPARISTGADCLFPIFPIPSIDLGINPFVLSPAPSGPEQRLFAHLS
jgi:hypothetical protein